MKLLIFLLSAYSAFGAFSAATAWDVRTTGNDANGGCFQVGATGTDRSQQDAPYITYTDIVVGGTTTQGTSVLNPFDATSPGNCAKIVSGAGCTVQWVQVVSVAGSTATFDKSLGTAASVCSGNYGGGMLTIATPNGLAVTDNSIYIKSGTYTLTAEVLVPSNIWLRFIGYNATHDDMGTRPLVTTATNTTNLFRLNSSNTSQFININMSNTASGTRYSAVSSVSGNTSMTINGVLIDGTGLFSNTSTYPIYVINSEIKNSTGDGIVAVASVYIYGSWIHDNVGNGITLGSNNRDILSASITRSIVSNNVIGLYNATANSNNFIQESAFVDNSSHGISLTTPYHYSMVNSIVYSNGGYGVTLSASGLASIQQTNAFGDNTSGNLNNLAVGAGQIALTANPFASSTNFALNSTAGGGALLKATGVPAAFPGGTTTGYPDVGPVQTQGGSTPATIACPMIQ